ncbi:CidA/LrgA family protein [Neisseriaceae bacterium ESL0693]|nr:CidA/LrgA family protein [Neisseriaceae bacterium ESL0693]
MLNLLKRVLMLSQTVWQMVLIGAVWWLSCALVRFTHIPLSGGVVGLFVMLFLLGTGLLPVRWVSEGARVLLGELMLFFIPILIIVVKYKALFMAQGWQLVVSIFVGTMLVMLSTAMTLKYCYRLRRYWVKYRHH